MIGVGDHTSLQSPGNPPPPQMIQKKEQQKKNTFWEFSIEHYKDITLSPIIITVISYGTNRINIVLFIRTKNTPVEHNAECGNKPSS